MKCIRLKIGVIVRYLPDTKIRHLADGAKNLPGPSPTMCSRCSRFHPNHFTFGGVIAEHVNCFLTRLQTFVDSNDNQFGFKKCIGCPYAIYTVCTVIDRWTSQGFTVNLCAIDLSKVFDKVNHHALFIKLIKRNIPVELLHIVENLFTCCLTSIKWFNLVC